MYEIEGYRFVKPVSGADSEYCRACGGAHLMLCYGEWSLWKVGNERHVERRVSIPRKDGAFISISGQAYPICKSCLKVLQDGEFKEKEQIILRILHPGWQELLPVAKEHERLKAELAAAEMAAKRLGQLDELFEEAREI